MRKSLLIILLMSLLSAKSFGQKLYGNEWINYSLSYYKIKIGHDGIYKIDYTTLQNAGVIVSNINPQNIRLFKNGVEESVYVAGEEDQKFDSSDYLLFYGKANDGKTDLPLYEKTEFQPNPYFSLYSDTSAYFLTIDNVKGKRLTTYSNTNSISSENAIQVNSTLSFKNTYYVGAYILASTSVSEYTEGEGYGGSLLGAGQSQSFQLNLNNYIAGSSFKLNYGVIGRSNASSNNSQGLNHHTVLEVSPDGTIFSKLADTSYRGYKFINQTYPSFFNSPTNNCTVRLTVKNDLGAATDFQAPTFFNISYLRDLNLTSNIPLSFKTLSDNPLVKFTFNSPNGLFAKPILFDLENKNIINGEISGNNISFTAKNNASKQYLLFDESSAESIGMTGVVFKNYFNATNPDFFIITHNSLLNAAKQYEQYRKQTGFITQLVTVQELYDQFYYGLPHPLGIRNYVQYIQDKLDTKTRYVLLLGKGLDETTNRYGDPKLKLVPTIGFPASDAMFSAPLYGNDLTPKINISRVASITESNVLDYLNKLKNYEAKPNAIERKNLIHVSGGGNINENLSWAEYQTNFNRYASKEYFGSKDVKFQKNVTQPITNNLREKIVTEINKGASLVSFLGHGSNFSTEINFGEPNELNNNTYLFYLINGCLAGNPNTTSTSIGETFINQPGKGAVGWLATSDEGVASYLASFSNKLYDNLFKIHYGESVTTSLNQAIKDFQNPNDILNRMQSRQTNLQGDPAIKFYSPSLPDYYLENGSAYIITNNPNSSLDSIKIGLSVKNLGKAISDSLKISLTRKSPDNSSYTYPSFKMRAPYNTDTIFFSIPTEGIKASGNNTLTLKLDPDNELSELNETNNELVFNFLLPGTGINLLYPKKNFSVNKTSVDLQAQLSDLFATNKSYTFELDTLADFSSSYKKTKTIIANALVTTNFNILNKKNQGYFWRAKIDAPVNAGGDWQYGYFEYNGSVPNNGYIFDRNNIRDNITTQNIILNNRNELEFSKTSFFVSLQTRGDDAPTTTERTYRSDPGGRLAFVSFEFTGFTLVAFDPVTNNYFSYPSQFNFQNYPPTYTGQYFFDLKSSAQADSLVRYINSIPDGYYVVGFNGRNNDLMNMPSTAKNAFEKLGCKVIQNVGAGEPYMFFGRKGASAGTALEIAADPNSTIPVKSQNIKYTQEYNPAWDNGSITTNKIGPVTSWNSIISNFKKENNDKVLLNVYGIDNNNNSVKLMSNIDADSISINSIDAKQYPFIKIQAIISDLVNRTPPQLQNILVKFKDIPETTFNIDLPYSFYSSAIQEGDSLKVKSTFQNISAYTTDSIKVNAVINKSNNQEVKKEIGIFAPLDPTKFKEINFSLNTLGYVGENNLKLEFIINNDSYPLNNQIKIPFTVKSDNKEPILNVTFDGRNIINKEIVSPSPKIVISLRDENEFLLLQDTSLIEVYLKKEEEQAFRRINYSRDKLVFIPASSGSKNNASVNFFPQNLPDGIYKLKIKSKDKTGNLSSTNDYEIEFEVVNESTITNFYPYPNPVVNNMKFVFTITGDKVPDDIKIQISNMSGKIVREVFKNELGNLKIGNNISDFSWDGTDQFGDRLANGVYFYKVIVKDTEDFKNRATTNGSKFFKNQTGKIYLLK